MAITFLSITLKNVGAVGHLKNPTQQACRRGRTNFVHSSTLQALQGPERNYIFDTNFNTLPKNYDGKKENMLNCSKQAHHRKYSDIRLNISSMGNSFRSEYDPDPDASKYFLTATLFYHRDQEELDSIYLSMVWGSTIIATQLF